MLWHTSIKRWESWVHRKRKAPHINTISTSIGKACVAVLVSEDSFALQQEEADLIVYGFRHAGVLVTDCIKRMPSKKSGQVRYNACLLHSSNLILLKEALNKKVTLFSWCALKRPISSAFCFVGLKPSLCF